MALLRSVGRAMARGWSGLVLSTSLGATWGFCATASLLSRARLLPKARAEAACRATCKAAGGAALACMPWVRQTHRVTPAVWAAFEDSARPRGAVLLINHASPMDPLFAMATMPLGTMRRVPFKVLIKASHLRVPLFGGICRGCGHFPVHFLNDKRDGYAASFRTDPTLQAGVMQEVDAHVASGGVLVAFPEGQTSEPQDAHRLAPFRRGSFKVALRQNAPVWALLQTGTADFAPQGTTLGGYPCCISTRLVPIREQHDVEDATTADELAEESRAKMQHQMDDMMAQQGGAPPVESNA